MKEFLIIEYEGRYIFLNFEERRTIQLIDLLIN